MVFTYRLWIVANIGIDEPNRQSNADYYTCFVCFCVHVIGMAVYLWLHCRYKISKVTMEFRSHSSHPYVCLFISEKAEKNFCDVKGVHRASLVLGIVFFFSNSVTRHKHTNETICWCASHQFRISQFASVDCYCQSALIKRAKINNNDFDTA